MSNAPHFCLPQRGTGEKTETRVCAAPGDQSCCFDGDKCGAAIKRRSLLNSGDTSVTNAVLLPCPKQYAEWNMLIQAATRKRRRGEVRALSRKRDSKYKPWVSTPATRPLLALQCARTRSRAASVASVPPVEHGGHSSQWPQHNRICCCKLDYELSGLQSEQDTNTDMIRTGRVGDNTKYTREGKRRRDGEAR